MKKILLVVAYDGSNYNGYQIQPGLPTIEGVLNKTLSDFLSEEIITVGASRTDTGVHAIHNVAVFNTATKIPAEKLFLAINTVLPKDIRIMCSREVSMDFHPRKNVIDKTYEYHILNSKVLLPTKRNYVYNTRAELDISAIKEAAKYFIGEKDFTSLCSAKTEKENKVRSIYSIDIIQSNDELTIRIRGNGFLYNMVRIIAGTLYNVGIGKIDACKIDEIIATKDRRLAGPTLPPQGLFLTEIRYKY